MIALERECATAAHWSEEHYRRLFSGEKGGLEWLVLVAADVNSSQRMLEAQMAAHPIAEGATRAEPPDRAGERPDLGSEGGQEYPPNRETVAGFLVASHVVGVWELQNLVVDPSLRRTGLGMRLLEDLLESARKCNSDALFLEVRESNTPARKLYEKAGFIEVERRRGYYMRPLEDAVIYRYKLR
jgi:ribosomal-protein-alanine acetyltransferase